MFNLEDQKFISLLNLNAEVYTHEDFKCKHIHLASDSNEKVFMVAFRTIPEDSTGVAHILEHTALCGSRKYPVRDPFFMMLRRSLNTFMNAFTSSDWTAYPFATLNDKDFKNLLSVYLDSSFFPNLDELDFLQEGHRVEFKENNNVDSELEIKGVVFNEMKGAMSSISSQLWHGMSKHLYPSTTYKHNSGGNPEKIIDLTHEYLVDFHKKHYHPSNATFFTYGNLDPQEIQNFIKENVLDNFQPSQEDIFVKNEERFIEPKTIKEFYNPLPHDEENNHVVLSWLLGESHDPVELLESYLMSNILLDNSASPLRKTLENSDLGKALSPLTGLETDHKELVFAAGLEGVMPNMEGKVENLILGCLHDVISKGVPDELIKSSLHQLEIRQREITGSGMPYGLEIMLSCLPACIHNDDPLNILDLDSAFEKLRANLKKENYIEFLIKKNLLFNKHRLNYSLAPDTKHNDRLNALIQEKINLKSEELSKDDKAIIVEKTKNLKDRQEHIDDPDVLPKVTLNDIPELREYPSASVLKNKNTKNYFYSTGTNGITYHTMIFPCKNLSEDEFKFSSLYASILSNIGLGNKSYEEIQKLQSATTGGVSASFILIPDEDNINYSIALKISSKCLEKNENKMQELMLQMVNSPNFNDLNRIKDMINFIASDNEKSLIQNGHILAMSNAGAQINNIAATKDMNNGIVNITNTSSLARDIDQNKINSFVSIIEEIGKKISSEPSHTFTASSKEIMNAKINLTFKKDVKPLEIQDLLKPQTDSIAWITGAQVCYCAEAFPTVDHYHPDAPILNILGTILRNGYLHSAIRERGGAYGSGAIQDNQNKIFKFFSYRDPKCIETFDEFKNAREWSLQNITEQQLEEGILGVISSIDKPLSPYGEAINDFYASLENISIEQRLNYRSMVKSCTIKNLEEVSRKYLFNNSKKSLIAGESYSDQIEKLKFKKLNI
tara:strand:- start:2214 stop:5078 length:2865 start_codon:yes stop_codon:yes gene_type:complete